MVLGASSISPSCRTRSAPVCRSCRTRKIARAGAGAWQGRARRRPFDGALLMLMKAQPLAYNKDNQEDKEPVFDTLDTVLPACGPFADMLPALQVKRDTMAQAARRGFSTATDLADYLVRKASLSATRTDYWARPCVWPLDTKRDLPQIDLDEFKKLNAAIGKRTFCRC